MTCRSPWQFCHLFGGTSERVHRNIVSKTYSHRVYSELKWYWSFDNDVFTDFLCIYSHWGDGLWAFSFSFFSILDVFLLIITYSDVLANSSTCETTNACIFSTRSLGHDYVSSVYSVRKWDSSKQKATSFQVETNAFTIEAVLRNTTRVNKILIIGIAKQENKVRAQV